MINGIINIYKEKGYTSHDVVAKLRGMLHQKKIGHTGTLDPDATGVLPVCLGNATKLCDILTDHDKVYEAVMLLGTTTDTQDVTGEVLDKKDVTVNAKEILDAINSFVGEYNQVPPMYSALKVNGQKLYELARQGITVERKPRLINIKSINVNEMDLDSDEKCVTFTVECSKGTYIRTLCDDIGQKLGCGACMKALKRTRVGQFAIRDSITLSQVAAMLEDNSFDNAVTQMDAMFDYPKLVVSKENSKYIYNGNIFEVKHLLSATEAAGFADGQLARVYDCDKTFTGVYRYEAGKFYIVKMFYHG